ncbi:MAG: ABC transporter permease [Acidobacteria bacterium]|nr:ABC transporter permease [Acidobacteriota bacterium]MBI3423517.1 ABC transporter permease [Acidobacteriota bacterium]
MQTLLQDLRYGFRMLLKTPGLTAIAVLSLALGIGANTALFSIVDSMLLKMLPVKEPQRLVLFRSVAPREFSVGSYNGNSRTDEAGQRTMTSFAYQSYQRMRERESPLSDLIAFGNVGLNVSADGQADVASGQAVSGNYFIGLGVQPVLGRLLTDEDDKASASPVAVLSFRYWQQRFGGNAAVVGKAINLNNVAFTVIGITPPGFEGTMDVGSTQDVSVPLAWEPQLYTDRQRSNMSGAGSWWLRLMGRLKPGATAEQARAQLENAFHQSVLEHRTARQAQAKASGGNAINDLDPKLYPRLYLDPGAQGEMNSRQYYRPSLYMLLGVVGLVLLIACANVANLLLSRAAGRQKEIALRLALGASRWRLIRQLLTESVLLSAIGGALGLLFAVWIKDGLLAVNDWGGRGMRALEPQLDWRVLVFTLALSLLTGIIFGLAPAWRSTNVDLTPALKDSGRSSSTVARSLLSRGLVVAQVALSLLLLIGAGLFVRTLLNLQRVEPGFNTQNLLLFGLQPGLIGYKDEKLTQLYQQLTERLEAVPGVQAVTFSRMPLLAQGSSSRGVFLRSALSAQPDSEGRIKESGEGYIHQVRENFLTAMEIPLLAGRNLQPQDDANAPRVVVVNQTFANKYFPNESPIGKRFAFDFKKPDEIEIVGLAKDAKYTRQRDEVPPTAYTSWRQELRSMGGSTFEVRTNGDPNAAINAVRQAVRAVDVNLPLNNIKTQVAQADETLRMERLFAKLMTLFGLLAQQLAAIGLFGVMAYAVSQRTHEIGIRMALGAERRDVLRMILRQGMTLAVLGVILGLVGAYVLTKYLESWLNLSKMLFGVKVNDPLTYGVIATVLTLVALVACFIPAWRATKVDPMIALRYE